MSGPNHEIVRSFISAMSDGNITGDLVTDDFAVWIVGTGIADRESFCSGMALLPKAFPAKLPFTIHSLTAEEDRVVAHFSAEGTLASGQVYRNDYLYLFRIRDGKVCYLHEFLNLDEMRGTLMPAMMEVSKQG